MLSTVDHMVIFRTGLWLDIIKGQGAGGVESERVPQSAMV